MFRISINIDRRIFLLIDRDSSEYNKIYKKRAEIERLNGRIDRDYMFNDHFIRGKKDECNVNIKFYSNVNDGKMTYKKI